MAKWPSDKELEEIYRKGSESHDFPYDPEAWNHMTLLMDKKRRRRFIIILLFGLGMLAISTCTYLMLNNDRNFNDLTIEWTEDPDNKKQTQEKIDLNSLQLEKTISSGEHINTSDSEQKNELDNVTTITDTAIIQNKTLKEDQAAVSRDNQEGPTIGQDRSFDEISAGVDKKVVEIVTPESQNLTFISENSTVAPEKQDSINTVKTVRPERSAPEVESTQAEKESTHSSAVTPKGHEITNISMIHKLPFKDLKFERGISIIIPAYREQVIYDSPDNFSRFTIDGLIGLESSWTPKGEYSSLDASLGLGVNYLINKKLGLTLGGSYVNDVYTAFEGDYHPPKGYWAGKGAPEFTTATCSMIETFYGISYYFNGVEKNGVTTNVSVLSNFMLNEMYYYHFTEQEDNFSNSWSMANNTWLSALSISADYRFRISEKWMMKTGPYIRIPIDGIGHGQVRLSTIGLRLGISFMSK